MRDPAFMSSHPTGVPAGLTELTPVIVNQSPELQSRRGFDSQQYEEEYPHTSQLYEQKQASAMDSYSSFAPVSYRGSRDRENVSHAPASGYYGSNQTSFTNNAAATSFDLAKPSYNAAYATTQESSTAEYSSMHQYGRVTSCQPQQGPPGTELRISLVTSVKLDVGRQVVARFARDDCQAICQGSQEPAGPYTYYITTQAPTQTFTQWSKPKSSIPVYIFIPYEGLHQSHPHYVGTFTYTETSAAASPSESELEFPRRASETAYTKCEPDSPRHGTEAPLGNLPSIKATAAMSSSYYAPSTYSTSGSDEYQTQASGSSYYTPSLVSSYTQTPGCTPPTPSWTGTATSTAAALNAPSSALMSAPQTLHPIPYSGTQAQPIFVRHQPKNGQMPSTEYGRYEKNHAMVVFKGDLMDMTKNWTAREKNDRRRLVVWTRQQFGREIHCSCEGVHPDERQHSMPVTSCIWWEERQDWFVTSVDAIGLLERLVVPGLTYSTEEKNRIRRNLEGYHPETIKKGKDDTDSLFKVIMNFPNPRPRHIEKDVKVFKWASLAEALKKIIGKYYPSYQIAGQKRGADEILLTPDDTPSRQKVMHDVHTLVRPAYSAPNPYYPPTMPLSAASSTFSESYAYSHPSYSQPQTPSYASYPSQSQQYPTGSGGMQDNSHMALQQHRPSVGYPSYLGPAGTAYMS